MNDVTALCENGKYNYDRRKKERRRTPVFIIHAYFCEMKNMKNLNSNIVVHTVTLYRV